MMTLIKKKLKISNILRILFLSIGIILISAPLYLVVLNSLKSNMEAAVISLGLPEKFIFKNYSEVFIKGHILRSLGNAFFVTTASVVLIIIFSSVASFIIQRKSTKLNEFLYRLFLAGLVAPIALIPEMKILQFLNISGTYLAIILIHTASNIPFSIMLYTGFIKGIPRQIDEAAVIDGCRPLRLFYQIIFPLLKPVIFTNLVIVFMTIWNDFQYMLYFVAKSTMWSMPLSVYNFIGFHTADYNLVCADIVICIVPVLLVFLFAQKYVISGMVAGAIKG